MARTSAFHAQSRINSLAPYRIKWWKVKSVLPRAGLSLAHRPRFIHRALETRFQCMQSELPELDSIGGQGVGEKAEAKFGGGGTGPAAFLPGAALCAIESLIYRGPILERGTCRDKKAPARPIPIIITRRVCRTSCSNSFQKRISRTRRCPSPGPDEKCADILFRSAASPAAGGKFRAPPWLFARKGRGLVCTLHGYASSAYSDASEIKRNTTGKHISPEYIY